MSVPVDQIGSILASGQGTMTPQGAAVAAVEGTPFAFQATPGAVPSFQAALAAEGGGTQPLSGTAAETASNNVFNQYLAQNGGAQAEQAAGISAPAAQATASGTPSFSWLDPFPWLAAEGLNILLIVLGTVTVIIVLTALFRSASNSSAAGYVRENAAPSIAGAKSLFSGGEAASETASAGELTMLATA